MRNEAANTDGTRLEGLWVSAALALMSESHEKSLSGHSSDGRATALCHVTHSTCPSKGSRTLQGKFKNQRQLSQEQLRIGLGQLSSPNTSTHSVQASRYMLDMGTQDAVAALNVDHGTIIQESLGGGEQGYGLRCSQALRSSASLGSPDH